MVGAQKESIFFFFISAELVVMSHEIQVYVQKVYRAI